MKLGVVPFRQGSAELVMKAAPRVVILFIATVAWSLGFWAATIQSSPGAAGMPRGLASQGSAGSADPVQSGAVCPVVYQLDQSPSARGYHYQFFGNAFFINEQGFLLTDAHVLETFRDGGEPYILVSRRESPPQLLRAKIVGVDKAHDVGILRADPNPFAGRYRVAFLSLSAQAAVAGEAVMALSLHPAHPRNAQSFQTPREDRSPSQVLSFQSTRLEKSAAPAEIFLLSHAVDLGQSGSPVLEAKIGHSDHVALGAVVGIIEGRWLRGSTGAELSRSSLQGADVPGAALPISYAIELLQRKSIAWHSADSARP